ncbi:hypothetical protein SDC9_97354 [bioreactor metagenome]|uniref:Uncharacterized protein n=1 Tax=bioreactor metagenome TaxID=1076179 RepID=A0A645ABM8_9ZZZZ
MLSSDTTTVDCNPRNSTAICADASAWAVSNDRAAVNNDAFDITTYYISYTDAAGAGSCGVKYMVRCSVDTLDRQCPLAFLEQSDCRCTISIQRISSAQNQRDIAGCRYVHCLIKCGTVAIDAYVEVLQNKRRSVDGIYFNVIIFICR